MDLGPAGQALYDAIVDDFELRPDELAVLESACRATDRGERVAAELAAGPLTVPGSTGQTRPSPLLYEMRAIDASVAGLLGRLKLRTDDDAAAAGQSASAQGRNAAIARWDPARRHERALKARDAARGQAG